MDKCYVTLLIWKCHAVLIEQQQYQHCYLFGSRYCLQLVGSSSSWYSSVVFLEQLEAVSSCGSFTPHFCICTGSGSVQQCSEILGWSLGNSAAAQCDECNWNVLSLARTQLYTKFRLWPSSLFSLLHSHHYLCHPTTVQGMSIWNPRTVMLLSQQSCAKESQSKTHSWLTQGSSTNSNILWQ